MQKRWTLIGIAAACALLSTIFLSPASAHHDNFGKHRAAKHQDETCSRCDGNTPCNACTNCSRCAWCSGGGTCGVCASTASTASTGRSSRTRAVYSERTIALPTPRPKPTPDPNAFHTLAAQKTVIVVPEVGMRKTAKDDSKRLRLLHKGDAVTILGAQSGHYQIMLADSSKGFVPKRAVAWVSGL